MGMPAHEYWEENAWLVAGYRKAYDIKKDETNATAWMNGMYVYVAVSTALANGFSNHKTEYPKEPFATHEKIETPEEIRERYYQRFKRLEELWNGRSSNNS